MAETRAVWVCDYFDSSLRCLAVYFLFEFLMGSRSSSPRLAAWKESAILGNHDEVGLVCLSQRQDYWRWRKIRGSICEDSPAASEVDFGHPGLQSLRPAHLLRKTAQLG